MLNSKPGLLLTVSVFCLSPCLIGGINGQRRAVPGVRNTTISVPPVLYVSPEGKDTWSGRFEKPIPDGKDGPLATLQAARDALRRLKKKEPIDRPLEILILPGTYFLDSPLLLTPEDSGSREFSVTFSGIPGKEPRISGGRRIRNWEKHGRVWRAFLPEVKAGRWDFFSLWVNGERRPCASLPAEGYFYTAGKVGASQDDGLKPRAGPSNAFRFNPGDIEPWEDFKNAIVVVYHSWEVSLLRIARIDMQRHIVVFTGKARWPFERWGPKQRYRIYNVKAAFDKPGQWYLDHRGGYLYYRPLPGEEPETAEVIVPRLKHLVLIKGDPEKGRLVENIRFRNLKFSHTAWPIAPEGHSDAQAAFSVGAAFEARGAGRVRLFGCEVSHLENYAVWFREGCRENRVFMCHLFDLGAGGVRIGEGRLPASEPLKTTHNRVENCFIHDGGNIFHGAVGIWIGQSSYNEVLHNEICDFYYTGVSVGWTWGFGRSEAHHNRICYNHIHDIGRCVMNDLGAIYTLGISPGTVEIGNLIHDIYCYVFGGWGIYTDEGSSEIRIEQNVVYNTTSGCFHQHYGRNNRIRNNIFAFAKEGILRRSREEPHISFILEQNIVLSRGTPFHIVRWRNGNYKIDRNLYWDLLDPDPKFYGMTFEKWRAEGRDIHSIVADPLFYDAERYDFRLKPGSPARRIGFSPGRVRAGLTGEKWWVSLPERVQRKPYRKPDLGPPSRRAH